VIAIAITLLVLSIHVPTPGPGGLAHELGREWPSFAAYVVSFLSIGVIWINHHAMLRRLVAVDHTMLTLNLLLLLILGILPWSTALMANFLRASSGQHLAAAVYAGSFLAMAVAFIAMQGYAMAHPALLRAELDPAARRSIIRRNRVGSVPYVLAIAAAALSSYLTLAICAAVVVFYALPRTTADPVRDGS